MSRTTRNLKKQFTDEELLEIGRELSQAVQEVEELEQHKKSINSEFKSRKDTLETTIAAKSDHISHGYAMMDIECDVVLNEPTDGMKTFTRVDTGESWSETMTEDDTNLFSGIENDDMPM